MLRRLLDSDLGHGFVRSPGVVLATLVTLLLLLAALFAPWVAPHDTRDVATLNLSDSFLPPAWQPGGNPAYLLGTDGQGRDMLSAMLFGLRISLGVSLAATVFALLVGVGLGLLAGWRGGWVDNFVMRAADVQLSFPAILVALLIDGFARSLLPAGRHEELGLFIVILAIGFTKWVQFARTVRASTLVEREKDYVSAARLIGLHPTLIVLRHVLPNILGPVLVIATIGLAVAILTEATLSFLGVGVPPTQPSLGTLIRVGGEFLFSGEWWIALMPGVALVVTALSINVLGDWLRDMLDPKLR